MEETVDVFSVSSFFGPRNAEAYVEELSWVILCPEFKRFDLMQAFNAASSS